MNEVEHQAQPQTPQRRSRCAFWESSWRRSCCWALVALVVMSGIARRD